RGEHDLGDAAGAHALLEQVETELAGADAVDRREMPHEHEVAAAVCARLLDREQIGRRLDDADLAAVTPLARTKAAARFFGEHPAQLAVANALHRAVEHGGKALAAVAVLVEEMERHALRRLAADAGQ